MVMPAVSTLTLRQAGANSGTGSQISYPRKRGFSAVMQERFFDEEENDLTGPKSGSGLLDRPRTQYGRNPRARRE